MAAVRAEIPIWAAALVMAAGVAMLISRRAVYRHIERSLEVGMPWLSRAHPPMRIALRGGFLLVAAGWTIAGAIAVVLNITGPLGE